MKTPVIDDEDDAWRVSVQLSDELFKDVPSLLKVRRYANAISKWATKMLLEPKE